MLSMNEGNSGKFQDWVQRIAWGVVNLVVDALVLLTVLMLLWSTWALALALYTSFMGGDSGNLTKLMVQVLTIFIFVEVFNLSVKYIKTHQVSVRDLAEVSIAVVLREVWVGMFSYKLEAPMILAIAVLIIALAVVRWMERQPSMGEKGTDDPKKPKRDSSS